MNKKDLIEKQTENYKISTTKSRCVKLELKDFNNTYFDFIIPYQQMFSKLIFKNKNTIDFKKLDTADHIFLDVVEEIKEKENITISAIKRQLIRPVLRRYKSYITRNKRFPGYPIAIRDKGLDIYDGCVEANKENKQISFSFHYKKTNKPEVFSYKSLGTMYKLEPFIKNNPGGQLKFLKNKTFFTCRVEVPVVWKYEPVDFIGFDFNKTKETFMTFSNNINLFGEITDIIPKTHLLLTQARKLDEELKELNKIKQKKHKIRIKIKKTHARHEKLFISIVDKVIDHCEKNKVCICIDNLTCGARTGSFGQDKVKKLLIKNCENKGIPFVIVPTPYTTRLCNKCEHLHDTIPPDIREFNCNSCRVNLLRDPNSAINIEKRGKQIWEIGIGKVDDIFKEKYGKSIFKS